ncbi:hypothetical protein [Sphingobium sp. UBA5915]|uniref:hypothetical protein n=2 Tax=Sphingobium TaxID=165695 RepID=UPI0025D303DD|nr:hypothetical protein [Sphingobium sp. UBA5915]
MSNGSAMRYSVSVLPALACLSLATAAIPHAAAPASVSFCGTPPPGWVPPGGKPVKPEQQPGPCHLMLCSGKKERAGRVPPGGGDDPA